MAALMHRPTAAATRLEHALMVAALAVGPSEIVAGPSAVPPALIESLTALGAAIEPLASGWRVFGRGLGGWVRPSVPLAFGAVTPAAVGALAGHGFVSTLTGPAPALGASLAQVRRMGAATLDALGDQLPLSIRGRAPLLPIEGSVTDPAEKAAVLLAGLHALGTTTVIDVGPADDLEALLLAFGADLTVSGVPGSRRIAISASRELVGCRVAVQP
jgi:5-enolpyruvylshikimate-3-phosphate synthase